MKILKNELKERMLCLHQLSSNLALFLKTGEIWKKKKYWDSRPIPEKLIYCQQEDLY